MRKLFSVIPFLFIFLFPVCAQDIQYARQVIQTLTSPEMHGRGYVNGGDAKAAAYIRDEYQKNKLIPVKENYFQPFQFSVNTFPSTMKVSVDGNELIPGKDFIVSAGFPSVKGKYEVKHVTALPDEQTMQEASGKFICVDAGDSSDAHRRDLFRAWTKAGEQAAGIIFIEPKKLTWTVSTDRDEKPMLYILRSAWVFGAKKISLDIKSEFNTAHKTQNVVGVIKGNQQADSFIVFSAHYDHLGRMGKETYFPGANDNASGIAMILNLAKYFSGAPSKYSIVFIAFAGEEAGLIGSEYFVNHPMIDLSKIKFLINLDLAGTGDDGIMVVNGEVFKEDYLRMKSINDSLQLLKTVGMRGKARNSDHYWFTEKGVPSFFIYTLGGISAYHDIYDKAETLPLSEFNDYFILLREFIRSF